MNEVNIRFPDEKKGVVARGPYVVGRIYSVPEDVSKHLIDLGAERATPDVAKKETAAPLDNRHRDNFEDVRAILKAGADEKKAEPEASAKTTAPVDAGTKSGEAK